MSKLQVMRLDVHQMKPSPLRGIRRSGGEWRAALTEPGAQPEPSGLRAVGGDLHTFSPLLNFLHGIFLTLFFNFFCQSSHHSPPFHPRLFSAPSFTPSLNANVSLYPPPPPPPTHSRYLYLLPSTHLLRVHLIKSHNSSVLSSLLSTIFTPAFSDWINHQVLTLHTSRVFFSISRYKPSLKSSEK